MCTFMDKFVDFLTLLLQENSHPLTIGISMYHGVNQMKQIPEN